MSGLWKIAAGVLAGNLIVHQLPVLPPPAVLAFVGLIGVIACRRLPVAAAGLLAFGFTCWAAGQRLETRWPAEADGRDVALAGWIDGMPVRDSGRTVFSFRVVDARVDAANTEAPRRVRLSWYDPAPVLVAGQALEVEARLRSPRGLANPGGFDYERWLLVEAYDATGYVRDGEAGTGRRFGVAQSWLEVRAGLAARIAGLVEDDDAAALIRALALGERGGFEDRHWTVLQRTGTSHLVAVSGLHIGMIAALAYGFVLRLALFLPYAIARHANALAAGFCIVPAAVYAALAGFTLPTRRALIMLLAVQLFVIARRRWPLGGTLSLALILILLVDPLASLTASFWLSFGAVALILLASARVERRGPPGRSRRLRALAGFCRLQFALTLGLAPFVIWFFGQVSVASFVVNLVAIPVFASAVVPASLVTALAAALGGDGLGIASVTGIIAKWTWIGLEIAAGHRLAAFELPRPPPAVLLLAIAAIAMALTRHRLPGRRLALLGLVPLAADHSVPPAPGFMRATILDVGHGLAVAMQTATHRVLYDAGPLYQSGFDAGAEIVGPALAALGGHTLDLVIVSHGDSDHAGGVPAIVARYPAARVIGGPDVSAADVGGRTLERCVAGEAWTFDGVSFSVLHPPESTILAGNDSSCVVLVETAAGKLLLTGDIEVRGETVVRGSGRLAADIVVVPHHGSQTSSTSSFVAAVAPRAAIVSAGHNNRWGFPRPDVRRRWNAAGAEVLVTGEAGAIDVVFGVDGIEIAGMRRMRRRYWQPKPVSGAIDVSAL
ncbi:MAG TPA: DNA internalization-related competence protein ComEC/Rec2 [Gammaproteobacteria bacterium]|nr:DNA internalization-related competence protein ComEC/Rec2 [Gammaproteobacteria bacterium]